MDTRSVHDDRGIFLGSTAPFHPPVSMAAPPPTQGNITGGLHHLGAMYHNLGSPHPSMRASPTQPTVAGQMSGLPAHFQGAGKCFPAPTQTLPGASSGSSYTSCLSSFLPSSRSPELFKHHQTEAGQPPHTLPLPSHYWPHASEGLHPFSPPFYPYLPLTALHPSAPGRIGAGSLADTNLPSLIQPPSHGDLLPFYHQGDKLNTSKDERHKDHVKHHISKTEHKTKRTNECNKKKTDKTELREAFKGQSNQKPRSKSNLEKAKLSSELSQTKEMQLKDSITENKSAAQIVIKTTSEMLNQSVENTSKAKENTNETIIEQTQCKEHVKHNEYIKHLETDKLKEEKQTFAKACIQGKDDASENSSERLSQANTTSKAVANETEESEKVHSDKVTVDSVAFPEIKKSDSDNMTSSVGTSSAVTSSSVTSAAFEVAPLHSSVTEPIHVEVAQVTTSKCSESPVSTSASSPGNTHTLEVASQSPTKSTTSSTSTFLTASSPVESLSLLSSSSSSASLITSSKYTVSPGQNKLSSVHQHQSSSLTSLPLYVNGTGCLTVQRESHRGVVKDGTKIHATTFVPAMGDYIPTFGSGSTHREHKPKSNPIVSGVDHSKVTVKKEKSNSCKLLSTSTETKDILNPTDHQSEVQFSLKSDSHFSPKQSDSEENRVNNLTNSIKVIVIDLCNDSITSVNKQNDKTDKIDLQTNTEDSKRSLKDQHIQSSKPISSRRHHSSGEDNSNKHLKNTTESYSNRKQDIAGVKTGSKVLEPSQGRSTPGGKAPPPVGIAVAQKRHGSKDSTSLGSRSRGKFSLHSGSRPSSVDTSCRDDAREKTDRPSSRHSIDGFRPPSNNRLGSNLIVTGGDDYRRSSLVKSDSSTPSLAPEHHWYPRIPAARPTYLPGSAYGLPSTHPATYNPAGGDATHGQVPLPPPGWQLTKDPTTGQLLWVPAIDTGGFPYLVPPHIQHPSHQLLMSQHMYGISQHERQEQATREYQAAIQQQHQAYVEYVRQVHERQEQHKRDISRSRLSLENVHSQDQAAEVTHCHPYLPGIGHLGLPSMYPGHGGTQYVFDPATRAFIPVPSPAISVDEKHRPKPSSSRGSSASELASPKSTSHSVKSESKVKVSKEATADVKSISVQTSTEPSVKDLQLEMLSKEPDKEKGSKEKIETKKVEERNDSSDCEVIDVGGTATNKPPSTVEYKQPPSELTSSTIKTELQQTGQALDLSMKTEGQHDILDCAKLKSLDNNNTESLPDNESPSKDLSRNDLDRSEDVTCAMQALLTLTACVPNIGTTEPKSLPDLPNVKPDIPDVKPNVSDVKPDVSDVKPDVSDVKRDIPDVKPDVSNIKPDVSDVKPDVPDVDTSQLASLGGIALLSAVAQHKAFCDFSFSDNSEDNESVNAVEPIEKLTGNTVSSADSQSASELLYKQRLAKMKKTEQSCDDNKLSNEVMHPNELEMRMKMAEIQRKYKERKRELDRLQRRKLKKVQKVDTKKSPGRPRKRKSHQAAKTVTFPTDRTNHPSSTDVLISAAAELDSLQKQKSCIEKPAVSVESSKHKNSTKISTKKTKLNKKGHGKPTELTANDVKKKNNKVSLKTKHKEGPTLTTFNDNKPKKKKKGKVHCKDLPKKVKSPKLSFKTNSSKEKVSDSTKAPTPEEVTDNQIVLDAIKRAVQKSSNKQIGPKTNISAAPVKKPEVQYSQVYGDSDTDDSQEESLTLAQVSFFTSNKTKPATETSTEKTRLLKPKKKKRSHSEDPRESVVKKKKKRKDGSKSSERTESKKKKVKKVKNQKSPKQDSSEGKKETLFDEEMWSRRRRSERIFLNDTSPVASRDVSPVNKKQTHLNQTDHVESSVQVPKKGTKLDMGLPSEQLVNVLDALTTDPLKMRKKLERLSGSGCDDKTTKINTQTKAVPAKVKEIYSDDDDDDVEDNCDSESENLPLSVLRERPASPAQRSCAISPEELCHGLRVLIPIDNLFYPGYVRPIQPPDVYGVIIDGQRGNRPHVFSQEQILKEAILDVKPKSVRYLPEGSRICAYWSQQYRCLYPGTVVKGSPNPTVNTNCVSVEFDDGDSGKILIDDIRLLPPDYPVLDIEPSTVLLERRRRRKTSSISANGGGPTISKQKPIQTEKSDCDMRLLSECEGDDDVFIKEKSPMKSPKKKIKSAEKIHKRKKSKELRKIKQEETAGMRNLFRKSDRSESDGNKSPRDGNKSKSKKKSKKFKFKKQISKEPRKDESKKRKYKEEKNPSPAPPDVNPEIGSLFATPFADSSDTVDSVTDGENIDMQIFPEVVESDSDNSISDSGTEDPEMRLMIAESKRRHYRQKSKTGGYRRHFWQWSGKCTQRRGIKGKAKKLFYKAISRGDEIVRVGECAVFLSTGRPHLPYIGRIESIWESWGGNMVVRVKWFYHPEETKAGRRPHDGKMALYLSPHVDENDVQTISHKCEVLSVEEYNQRIKKNNGKYIEDMYYFAGTYDPTNGHLVPVSQMENKA